MSGRLAEERWLLQKDLWSLLTEWEVFERRNLDAQRSILDLTEGEHLAQYVKESSHIEGKMAHTMTATQASLGNTPSKWIHSAGFDLTFITGGAFFTLGVAAAAFAWPGLLPVFFWLWVVLFEGSHFWATLSRTYFDQKFRRENPSFLWGSLVFFLLPALAVGFDGVLGGVSTMLLYGFFIFTWSLYHNARQHFGFFAIYSKKAGLSAKQLKTLATPLYVGIAIPQLYFLFNFKAPLTFSLPLLPGEGELAVLLQNLPPLLSGGVVAYFAWQVYQLAKAKSIGLGPVVFYALTCFGFYSIMFYQIAPLDQFVQTGSGAQALLLIAIMNSLFHNIQYHGIVWYYSRSRYQNENESFGLARLLNGTRVNYVATALLMGGVFGLITWYVGDAPDVSGSFAHAKGYHWAYVLFFGIIGHHFYLDQKIWRPSRQQELNRYLLLDAKG